MIDTVKIAKALSDPIRYKIMLMLAQGKVGCCPITGQEEDHRPGLCNCEFVAEMGLIQSRVSYHMKELADAGLVIEEPRGKWKMYFINAKTLRQYCEQIAQDFKI
ncbi:MAG: metalloregulator ArsR/SmtB family transcription factor [Desulfotomaculaceae bacterium]|nr:metalloregulator ArsR/SmtB family transcription factor [Desulfotomaculaceae bacterium]